MKYDYQEILRMAVGNYTDIIKAITNLPETTFNKKGQPCPMCAGKDRFRYTDRNGEGAYVCRGCGGGSGVDLIMKSTGMEFPEVIEATGDYLNAIPVERREVNRQRAVAKAAMPKYSESKEEDAEELLSNCKEAGIGKYMQIHSVTNIKFPMLNESTAVVPIQNNFNVLVNAAKVMPNGDIEYCGNFTYGGFGLFGEDNGANRYLCVDLIDALIVQEYTKAQVLWIGKLENYHAVFSTLTEEEKARTCAATNWLMGEFHNINACSMKMILPPHGRSIQTARKLTRYYYDPEVFIKSSEHGFKF